MTIANLVFNIIRKMWHYNENDDKFSGDNLRVNCTSISSFSCFSTELELEIDYTKMANIGLDYLCHLFIYFFAFFLWHSEFTNSLEPISLNWYSLFCLSECYQISMGKKCIDNNVPQNRQKSIKLGYSSEFHSFLWVVFSALTTCRRRLAIFKDSICPLFYFIQKNDINNMW